MAADVRIEIGKTDGYHYLGAQPPSALDGVDVDQLELPYGAFITSTGTDFLRTDRAYAHIGYDSGSLPPDLADEAVVETAHRLAKLITETNGATVDVRPEVHWIGFGKYLFDKAQ